MLMHALALRGIFPADMYSKLHLDRWVAGLERHHAPVVELMSRLTAMAMATRAGAVAGPDRLAALAATRAIHKRVQTVEGRDSDNARKARRVVQALKWVGGNGS